LRLNSDGHRPILTDNFGPMIFRKGMQKHIHPNDVLTRNLCFLFSRQRQQLHGRLGIGMEDSQDSEFLVTLVADPVAKGHEVRLVSKFS
jgi:hypothetical protein